MGQIGAVAALRECQDDVERMRQAYDARRRALVDGLNAAGLPTFEPEGAFYAFPDITSTGLDSETFAQRLLQEERVACVPGDAFGAERGGLHAVLLRDLARERPGGRPPHHRFAERVRAER
jgi:aminotransferase